LVTEWLPVVGTAPSPFLPPPPRGGLGLGGIRLLTTSTLFADPSFLSSPEWLQIYGPKELVANLVLKN